jgi:hypothetical protein
VKIREKSEKPEDTTEHLELGVNAVSKRSEKTQADADGKTISAAKGFCSRPAHFHRRKIVESWASSTFTGVL